MQQDVGNIIWLDHIHLEVPDLDIAHLFYGTGTSAWQLKFAEVFPGSLQAPRWHTGSGCSARRKCVCNNSNSDWCWKRRRSLQLVKMEPTTNALLSILAVSRLQAWAYPRMTVHLTSRGALQTWCGTTSAGSRWVCISPYWECVLPPPGSTLQFVTLPPTDHHRTVRSGTQASSGPALCT